MPPLVRSAMTLVERTSNLLKLFPPHASSIFHRNCFAGPAVVFPHWCEFLNEHASSLTGSSPIRVMTGYIFSACSAYDFCAV